MFDGAELNGMHLEVREERFTLPASGPFGRNGGLDPDAPRNPASMAGGRHIPPSRQIYVKNVRSNWKTTADAPSCRTPRPRRT